MLKSYMTLPFVLSVVEILNQTIKRCDSLIDEEYKKSGIGYGNTDTIKRLSKLIEQVDTIAGTKTYSNFPKLSLEVTP